MFTAVWTPSLPVVLGLAASLILVAWQVRERLALQKRQQRVTAVSKNLTRCLGAIKPPDGGLKSAAD